MKKAVYVVSMVVMLWMIASTVQVWCHNSKGNEYSKYNIWVMMSSHTTDMIVVEVNSTREMGTNDYEVVVEDIEGNQWAYIDTEQREIGTVMQITMTGNEIIDAR